MFAALILYCLQKRAARFLQFGPALMMFAITSRKAQSAIEICRLTSNAFI